MASPMLPAPRKPTRLSSMLTRARSGTVAGGLGRAGTEDGRAHADDRRAFLDRDLVVRAHAHRAVLEPRERRAARAAAGSAGASPRDPRPRAGSPSGRARAGGRAPAIASSSAFSVRRAARRPSAAPRRRSPRRATSTARPAAWARRSISRGEVEPGPPTGCSRRAGRRPGPCWSAGARSGARAPGGPAPRSSPWLPARGSRRAPRRPPRSPPRPARLGIVFETATSSTSLGRAPGAPARGGDRRVDALEIGSDVGRRDGVHCGSRF